LTEILSDQIKSGSLLVLILISNKAIFFLVEWKDLADYNK